MRRAACWAESWRRWLFEARKRYDLCVLNYIAPSNHMYLLVLGTGRNEIPATMRLVAGRTAPCLGKQGAPMVNYMGVLYLRKVVQQPPVRERR